MLSWQTGHQGPVTHDLVPAGWPETWHMTKARMKRVESGTVAGGCHVAVPEGKGSLVVALLTRKGQALDSCNSANTTCG